MIEIVLLSYKYNIIKIKQQRKGFYFMKKTGRRFLAFMMILSMVLVYSQAVFAYDFSGAQPKTVALEGVSGYAPYGGTAKIGLTWSTNDPAKLVGGLFNLIKKDGSDIPAGDSFYVSSPEGSGNEWMSGPNGYSAYTTKEFASETAKWSVENVTQPHTFEFSAKSGAMFVNNEYEYEEHLVGSPAVAKVYLSLPVEVIHKNDKGATTVTGIFNDGACEQPTSWSFSGAFTRDGKYVGTAPSDSITITTSPEPGYEARVSAVGGIVTDNHNGTWTVKGTVPSKADDKLSITVSYKGNVKITWDPDGGNIAGSPGNKVDENLTPGNPIVAPEASQMTKVKAVFNKWINSMQQDIPALVENTSVTYKALWDQDENEDGIADKNQLKFKFTAEADGTLEAPAAMDNSVKDNGDGTYTVYLTKNSAGKAELKEEKIPGVKANTGFAFDRWDNLKPADKKSPAGEYSADKTFTAKFAGDVIGTGQNPNAPDGIADIYQMMFTFKVGANGMFDGSVPLPVVKTKFDVDGVTMSETGKTKLTVSDIPKVKGTSNSYILSNWTVSDGVGNKTSDELLTTEYSGGNKTITANFANAKADLKIVEDYKVAKGAWKNEAGFALTVQLRIGDAPATKEQVESVKLDAGTLYREKSSHFPGAITDYMNLDAPEFGDYKKVDIGGKQYGQMVMKLKKTDSGKFKSCIATFTASYDDGIVSNTEHSDKVDIIVPGDISRNGKIFMEDVVALKREISGVHTPFSTLKYFKEMADMSSNGTIFIEDLVIINRMILSSIKSN